MEIAEGVKLQMCYLLHHMNDIQLRHRVESIVAFSHDYIGEVQTDQLKRYNEIKQSDLPSAVAAKKTREFRCPPVEQMKSILGFKNLEMDDEDNRPCGESLITQLTEMHQGLMEKISLDGVQNEESGDVKNCNCTNLFSMKSHINSLYISGWGSWRRKVWIHYQSNQHAEHCKEAGTSRATTRRRTSERKTSRGKLQKSFDPNNCSMGWGNSFWESPSGQRNVWVSLYKKCN